MNLETALVASMAEESGDYSKMANASNHQMATLVTGKNMILQ